MKTCRQEPRRRPLTRARLAFALVVALLTLPAAIGRLLAHDIPADTTVRAFIRPEGEHLRFLVRVPMASIHEIDWPVKKEDGTLDIPQVEPAARMAVDYWITEYTSMYEGSTKLGEPTVTAVHLSLENSPFGTYEEALATITAPSLPASTKLLPLQGALDAILDYPIQSDRSRFSFHPRFDRFGLRVLTILQYQPPTRPSRAFEYDRGDPGIIRLDPTLWQAAWNFGRMGFVHILDGPDHLLFLLCLVIPFVPFGPFSRFSSLVAIVTGFTIAHSVTLIASAYDMAPGALWFPPLVDTLIAASILYMAFENIVVERPRRRWIMSFAFGLVHGFAFAFALRSSQQFAGSHLLASLLSFNLGIEIGLVLMLAAMVIGLGLLFKIVPVRGGTIVLSALAGHTAWHWMIDRYSQLSRYRFEWPALDAAFLANAMRWLMVLVALAFVYWLTGVLRKEQPERT